MSGLIKKDFLMIKSSLRTYFIVLVIYIIMAFQGDFDISIILPFFCVLFMISTFSYDDFNNWNAYAVTLPNGRKNLVRAKYLTTIILIIGSLIGIILLSFLISSFKEESINYGELLATSVGISFGTVMIFSLMYPIIFKLGVEKARITIFVIVFALIFLVMGLFHFINFDNLNFDNQFFEKYYVIIFAILLVLMLFISYKISQAILKKKEF